MTELEKQAGTTEEAAQGGDDTGEKGAAVILIIIAAVLTIVASVLSNVYAARAIHAKNSAVLATAAATERWGYYHEKSIKTKMYEIQVALNRGSKLADDFNVKIDDYKAEAMALTKEARGFEDKAKKLEKQAGENMQRHTGFAIAEGLLAITIALLAIAAITGRKNLRTAGVISIVAGVVFLADGFFPFIPL